VEAIRRIEAELREAETRNADLTAQLAALRAAHGDAGSRAAADGQTIDALRRDLAAVVRERDALQSDLGAQNTRLRKANDGKDREIAALQHRLAAAERRITEPPLAVPSVPPPPPPPASDTPGGNADVVQGISAYQAGNYADAYRIWRPLAERGVARAQFHLGALYYEGRGVARDLGLARRWLERALANGYAPAEVLLARVETDAGARGTPPAGDR
jgi:TPR repeat protein